MLAVSFFFFFLLCFLRCVGTAVLHEEYELSYRYSMVWSVEKCLAWDGEGERVLLWFSPLLGPSRRLSLLFLFLFMLAVVAKG